MDTLENPSVDETTDIAELIQPYEDDFDPNIRTHIINPPNNPLLWQPGMSSQDVVDLARSIGVQVVALCGFKFVPKRNPDKYPACEKCMEEAGNIIKEMG